MTAAEAVAAWCRAWQGQDLAELEKHTQKTYLKSKSPAWVLRSELLGFVIDDEGSSVEGSKVMYDVKVTLKFDTGSKQKRLIRVICEKGPMKPSTKGDWGVNPVSMLRKQ
jgi:hypothetical protein